MHGMPDLDRGRTNFIGEREWHPPQFGTELLVRHTSHQQFALVVIDVRNRQRIEWLPEFERGRGWYWSNRHRRMISSSQIDQFKRAVVDRHDDRFGVWPMATMHRQENLLAWLVDHHVVDHDLPWLNTQNSCNLHIKVVEDCA